MSHNSSSSSPRIAQMMAWLPSTIFVDGLLQSTIVLLSVVFYKQMGLGNDRLTFLVAWLFLPQVLRPLWSNLLNTLWREKQWIVTAQFSATAALGTLAFSVPSLLWLSATFLCFIVLAMASALHHHFCTRQAQPLYQSNKSGLALFLQFVASLLAFQVGYGVLTMIAGNLQVLYRNSIDYSWSLVFYIMAGILGCASLWHLLVIPHYSREYRSRYHSTITHNSLFKGLYAFVSPSTATLTVTFILLFVVPEALLLNVGILFLLDSKHHGGLGLSPQEFGLVQGITGVIVTSLGIDMGRMAIRRLGLKRCLIPMALVSALGTIPLWALSLIQPRSLFTIGLLVAIRQWCSAVGFSAYMSYLASYSGDGSPEAKKWGEALYFFVMMILVMFSGSQQLTMGYSAFFSLTIQCALCPLTAAVLVRLFVLRQKKGNKDQEALPSMRHEKDEENNNKE